MKIADVVSFINPFGDALSTIFVLILVSLSVLTVVWVYLSANAENWESIWYGEHLDDDANLDSEHGSVQELSEAVATKAEQIADIMPSMILIIGLLGTFVGLGIALNSASEVLASANTSGMDTAMANLMGLMEGLGAKFKTSTWGLFCFIALNIAFNILGFKEKRLTWAIAKVREEVEAKNAQKAQLEQDKYEKLLKFILFIDEQNQARNAQWVEFFSSAQQKFLTQHDNTNHSFQKLLSDNFNAQLNESKNLISTNQSIHQSLKDNHQSLLKSLSNQNELVIKTLTQEFEKLHKAFEDNSEKSLEQLQKIAEYNQQTQQAMQDFVEKTVSSMASIGESANKMGESALAVGESADDLNDVVKTLKSELGDVMEMIKKDLGKTINDMSDNFKKNITEMSASITTNMSEMSSSMSEATKGIEGAVADLSKNVDKTMTEVTQTIGKSMELQEKSAREFTVTSESLNMKIIEMTDLVNQLKGDIVGSLKSVAENGRRMDNIGKKLEGFSEFIENLSNTNPQIIAQLEKITTHNEEIANSLSQLLEKNEGEHWQNLMDVNKSIKNELNTLVDLLGQSMHKQHYEKILENIHSSIDDLSKQLAIYHQNQQKELTHAEKAE